MSDKPSRKQQILQSLATMLEQSPGARITTAGLARQVGVSEAALYRHFPSKAKMFDALIEFIEDTIFSRINLIMAEEDSASARCAQTIGLLLAFAEKNPGITRILTGDPLSGEADRLRGRVAQFFDRFETHLRQILREAEIREGRRPVQFCCKPDALCRRGPHQSIRQKRFRSPAHGKLVGRVGGPLLGHLCFIGRGRTAGRINYRLIVCSIQLPHPFQICRKRRTQFTHFRLLALDFAFCLPNTILNGSDTIETVLADRAASPLDVSKRAFYGPFLFLKPLDVAATGFNEPVDAVQFGIPGPNHVFRAAVQAEQTLVCGFLRLFCFFKPLFLSQLLVTGSNFGVIQGPLHNLQYPAVEGQYGVSVLDVTRGYMTVQHGDAVLVQVFI
jgi:TetR/AcrR family transcriptional regulator